MTGIRRLCIAPFGPEKGEDVPDWYRELVWPRRKWKSDSWIVDPENQLYAEYFGKFITELGKRYDGHPDLESDNLSIVGFWGEGSGSALLTQQTREALVRSYTYNF